MNLRCVLFLIAAAVLVLTGGIQAWAHDPEATQTAARIAAVGAASAFFGLLYIRCIATVVDREERFSFRLRDLLALTIAVAAFSVTGFATDALVPPYASAFGPFWKRLIGHLTGLQGRTATYLASAAVFGSFVVMATVLAVVLTHIDWPKSVPYPMTLRWSLWTSAIFAWVFVLGDNARDDLQLVLYGLPVGILVNIILALIGGALFGWLAVAFSERRGQETWHDSID